MDPVPVAFRLTVPLAPVVRLPLRAMLSLVVPLVARVMLPLLAVMLPLSVSAEPAVSDTEPLVEESAPVSVSVPVAVIERSPVVAVTTASLVRLPVSLKFTVPAEMVPEVERFPVSVTVKDPPTVEVKMLVEAVSVTETEPAVEKVRVPASVLERARSPLPVEVNDTEPVSSNVPLVWDTEAVLVVRVVVEAVMSPKVREALAAELVSFNVKPEVAVPEAVIAELLSVTDTLPPVEKVRVAASVLERER